MPAERATAAAAPLDARPALRVAVVGMSVDDPCGVHDHATILAAALAGSGASCSLHWLSRSASTLGAARAEARAWAGGLAQELERERVDAVLLHYSVFAFSHRGLPVLTHPAVAAIRRTGLPLVTVMHEYAYPWRLGGARGKVWASTQRVALRNLVAASSGLVTTADARAAWLRSRVWLPRRPISVAPVFSNLPAASEASHARGMGRLGLFGYAHEGVQLSIVLDAVRALRARGREVELTLLGAPGRPSPAAARWERSAAERGVAGAIGFSGRLAAQQLADALAACDVLLFAERGGATSRKTTLAASLASGRPLVALDGPNGWPELARAGAATIVAPNAPALADAIARLLGDGELRERQGALGRAFARRAMSVERSADVVVAALIAALDQAPDGVTSRPQPLG